MVHGREPKGWVPPRCPYATVHRCPRYYQSLWLLGQYGGATQIDSAQDEALLEKWRASDLWPVTSEQEPSVYGPEGNPKMFNRFCPEVSYDRFGWFATDLYRYTDEIDLNAAHAKLGSQGTRGEDWRWAWETVHPMHYTECPLYSLLTHRPVAQELPSEAESTRTEKIVDLRPTLWGMSLNVNVLLSRIRSWWKRRRAAQRPET